ncbi:hypothetical protein [Streptomyces hydrogenans]
MSLHQYAYFGLFSRHTSAADMTSLLGSVRRIFVRHHVRGDLDAA